MLKLPQAIAIVGAASLPFAATLVRADETPEHSFTGKVALYSE